MNVLIKYELELDELDPRIIQTFYCVVNNNDEFYCYGYETNEHIWNKDFRKAKIYKDIKWAKKIVDSYGKDNCMISKIDVNIY